MNTFLEILVKKVKVPLMIDSTDAVVIEAALERCQGKAIINIDDPFASAWKSQAGAAQVLTFGFSDADVTASDIVLEPGQISLHDVYLVHGSEANLSDKRRMGLVLRIMPSTSFYNHDSGKIKEDAGSPHGYSSRALFLLRGKDKSGRNDFNRGH